MEDRDGGIFKIRPENEIECQVILETEDDVMSFRSTARFSMLKGTSSKDVEFSFLNELFVLLVSPEEISLSLRDVTSAKIPLRQLENVSRMLAWRDQDVRIRITGDVPDIAPENARSGRRRNTPGQRRCNCDRSATGSGI